MLYQEMLTGKSPYRMFIKRSDNFKKHAHLEIEIMYCMEGSSKVVVGGKTCAIEKGEVLFIGSMIPHETMQNDINEQTLVLEIGPTLLRGNFKKFSGLSDSVSVINTKNNEQLKKAMDEAVEFCKGGEQEELLALSQIYKVCGTLSNVISKQKEYEADIQMQEAQRIEKALHLIYGQYALPVSVDDAASLTGYGKSNFCKIFKRTYGESFHKMLNRHRVENACYLLNETDLSVEEIAQSVGFEDVKTFYRVFKVITGITPKEFRTNG